MKKTLFNQRSIYSLRNLKTFGEETSTWVVFGTVVGSVIGAFTGSILYLLFSFGGVNYPRIEAVFVGSPFIYFFIVFIVSAIFGGIAGALIGIGVPKANPHPQQGVVTDKNLKKLPSDN